MDILNTWQFNMIGYYIFIVLFYQCYKLAVRDAKEDGAATIVLQVIAGLSILVLAPLLPMTFPSDPRVYALLLLATIFYALSDRMNTTVRKNLEVSVYSVLTQLINVFLIVFGIFIFKEPFTINKFIGASLILLGNFLLKYKRGGAKFDKYFWLAVISAFTFSIAITVDIGISKQFNLPFYIMITLIVPALMLLVGERIHPKKLAAEFNTPDKKWYIITGLAWGLTIFFSLRAFQFGEITTVVPLQAVAVLLNVLFAYVIFHERTDRLKKLMAAVLVIAGAIFTVSSF